MSAIVLDDDPVIVILQEVEKVCKVCRAHAKEFSHNAVCRGKLLPDF